MQLAMAKIILTYSYCFSNTERRTIQDSLDFWSSNRDIVLQKCRKKRQGRKRICTGHRVWQPRRFQNGDILPEVLIVNVEACVFKTKIGEVVTVGPSSRYTVFAITYGNGNHFICEFFHDGSGKLYDGLKNKVQPQKKEMHGYTQVHALLLHVRKST
ncbi:uncharacterized protein LOC132743033 [Ruditapes philippinarum]|uniref:uncharacterized protein LOC132743033 n=1 Tax=Ruditapes philippinarum TaxID=129788 RepID=UPI00295B5928|nr:uncharacterized protein LOC132743033 [Ruditapes philippinarum]